ncbi:MAG: alpha/beta hydrolase-fold protein [Candidatus Riflebacteria bacterium]|nr:alpha/beta hydrolase-fold protein [Candidatus Riflebacteria bacterium]
MKRKFLAFTVLALIFVMHTAGTFAASVSIVVSVPPSTPAGDKICITGNHPLLSDWSGAGVELREIGPGLFSFAGEFSAGTVLEYKFTRGDFSKVEKSAQGFEQPNRKLLVKEKSVNEKVQVGAWADQVGVNVPAHEPLITGDYKILRGLKSQFLALPRDVIVWLPPSYNRPEASKRRYPVIYMHDGGNLFDPGSSFGGVDWGVDEAMTEGIANGELNEAIIVGIGNTADRMSEYTPFPDPKHKGGKGASYARFLVEELKVKIDKEFRTRKDQKNTFVGGSSLGGLISLYLGVSHPGVFAGVIAMSPSIWWSEGKIIDWLIDNGLGRWQGKIWADMGTREGEEAIRFSRLLAETVKSRCPEFRGLVYREFSGGTHSEGSWKQRIHLPLRLFIGKNRR